MTFKIKTCRRLDHKLFTCLNAQFYPPSASFGSVWLDRAAIVKRCGSSTSRIVGFQRELFQTLVISGLGLSHCAASKDGFGARCTLYHTGTASTGCLDRNDSATEWFTKQFAFSVGRCVLDLAAPLDLKSPLDRTAPHRYRPCATHNGEIPQRIINNKRFSR